MSQFGFHITHKSNIEDIQSEGLHASTEGEWRKKRRKFRQQIDEYAAKNFTDWLDRECAVFFWTSISDAERFSRTAFEHSDEYRIITVDLSDYTVWTADNQIFEHIYSENIHTEIEGLTDSEENIELEELGQTAQEWTGEQRTNFELWCQGPIDPEDITDIR